MRYLDGVVGVLRRTQAGTSDSYPHSIIHEAASAMKRQYQGSVWSCRLVLLSMFM